MIYLYVKTHLITNLKYFGKTTRDPMHYKGSGKYWKSHLKKHGNSVKTEIVACFEDENKCKKFALEFSKKHDIVSSENWANLVEENGLDGAPKGNVLSDDTKSKISKSLLGKPSIKTKYIIREDISKRRERCRNSSLGRYWINNGTINKRIVDDEIPEGWTRGRIQNGKIGDKNLGKRNDGSNTRNKIMYNNGFVNKFYFENTQPEGWIIGRLIRNKKQKE